ncbi:MAG: response regulator transcription factor [bacterium]
MNAKDETILIIEDDAALAQGLGHNLRYEGYHVRLAADGRTGLELALERTPDLIVLDLMMPGMPGLEVLRELRRQGVECQVIILTARDLETDKVAGLELGADDYVTKPFGLRELLARVTAALRRPRIQRQQAKEEVLRFGELAVRPASRQVTRGGELLRLTAKEFDLLLHFVRHPERPYSRTQLLEQVWGDDYDGTERTVDNFIRKLRSKLEPDPTQPTHLETVHGVGYRFMP